MIGSGDDVDRLAPNPNRITQPFDEIGVEDGMVRVYPKPNCPRCYGRGWVGEADGGRVDCSCLVRAKAHVEPKQRKWGAQ